MPTQTPGPVVFLAGETDQPSDGIGLALSGGGYRAMLFHLGSLWRLCEVGLFEPQSDERQRLERLSSVSGGSITAAALGMNWAKIAVAAPSAGEAFEQHVVRPVRNLAGQTVIGRVSAFRVMILPGSISNSVAKQYSKHLFGSASLQDLPDHPRFVINATNLQSGALWRFSKPYVADWRVGMARNQDVSLARAVGASSAFPPFLSPARFIFREQDYDSGSGDGLQRPPFTTKPTLSDGGVYDNLGLETVYKRYRTLLVSNAGGKLEAKENVPTGWARQSYRVLNVIDNQVRSLRVRQLIAAYESKVRSGAYWSIRTNIDDYSAPNKLPCPFDQTTKLAEVGTDLSKKNSLVQERLINWGYAACDAAIRTYYDTNLPAPAGFPYPSSAVG